MNFEYDFKQQEKKQKLCKTSVVVFCIKLDKRHHLFGKELLSIN